MCLRLSQLNLIYISQPSSHTIGFVQIDCISADRSTYFPQRPLIFTQKNNPISQNAFAQYRQRGPMGQHIINYVARGCAKPPAQVLPIYILLPYLYILLYYYYIYYYYKRFTLKEYGII